jgi:uncharacterized protein YtpQ (UPF0354 family)
MGQLGPCQTDEDNHISHSIMGRTKSSSSNEPSVHGAAQKRARIIKQYTPSKLAKQGATSSSSSTEIKRKAPPKQGAGLPLKIPANFNRNSLLHMEFKGKNKQNQLLVRKRAFLAALKQGGRKHTSYALTLRFARAKAEKRGRSFGTTATYGLALAAGQIYGDVAVDAVERRMDNNNVPKEVLINKDKKKEDPDYLRNPDEELVEFAELLPETPINMRRVYTIANYRNIKGAIRTRNRHLLEPRLAQEVEQVASEESRNLLRAAEAQQQEQSRARKLREEHTAYMKELSEDKEKQKKLTKDQRAELKEWEEDQIRLDHLKNARSVYNKYKALKEAGNGFDSLTDAEWSCLHFTNELIKARKEKKREEQRLMVERALEREAKQAAKAAEKQTESNEMEVDNE